MCFLQKVIPFLKQFVLPRAQATISSHVFYEAIPIVIIVMFMWTSFGNSMLPGTVQ